MGYWVYMVRCCDGSLYTGSAADVDKRTEKHNSGKGAKYTRSRRPVTVVYREECEDRSAALKREAAIKKLTRGEKLRLAEGFSDECVRSYSNYHSIPNGVACPSKGKLNE